MPGDGPGRHDGGGEEAGWAWELLRPSAKRADVLLQYNIAGRPWQHCGEGAGGIGANLSCLANSSCAGLTRASIFFARKFLRRSMDCRVKPGNDDLNVAPVRSRPGSSGTRTFHACRGGMTAQTLCSSP